MSLKCVFDIEVVCSTGLEKCQEKIVVQYGGSEERQSSASKKKVPIVITGFTGRACSKVITLQAYYSLTSKMETAFEEVYGGSVGSVSASHAKKTRVRTPPHLGWQCYPKLRPVSTSDG